MMFQDALPLLGDIMKLLHFGELHWQVSRGIYVRLNIFVSPTKRLFARWQLPTSPTGIVDFSSLSTLCSWLGRPK